ncbi:MAG: hypothetical protein HYS13_16830 [Planctomycetia bacterium]|nr:hypothetical protein [Planctomycetia bacterium]
MHAVTTNVVVTAGCRLHFGMFAFNRPGQRNYGGLGMMIEPAADAALLRSAVGPGQAERFTLGTPPIVRVELSPAATFRATGAHADRAMEFARSYLRAANQPEPKVRLDVQAPRQHTGLGVGTALGLAVATALASSPSPLAVEGWGGGSSASRATRNTAASIHQPDLAPAFLARSVGRGARSAIGVHGFFHGGLIVDAGKRSADELGALAARVEVPDRWRILLLCPQGATGLSGREEREAFEALPPVPESTTAQLCRLALLDILPAAREDDFPAFASALHHFGALAGTCFAPRQFGSYSSPWASETVALLSRLGVPCVVQSSWGATLAALFPDAPAALGIAGRLASVLDIGKLELQLARPRNEPAANELLSCRTA